jgi:hypothetical protein
MAQKADNKKMNYQTINAGLDRSWLGLKNKQMFRIRIRNKFAFSIRICTENANPDPGGIFFLFTEIDILLFFYAFLSLSINNVSK